MENLDQNINENTEISNEDGSFNHGNIEETKLTHKLRTSFLNYAMSVIVDRALPDARDGLKPVQRRILYGMDELHVSYNTAHKKCARIVGDVMGKYHPHGDSSIYDALARMAQDFNYRYMLVDGHGNFGSVDGDSPAAMRYTEARLAKISSEMLRDIKKNTVDFQFNYDATEREPVVLPARYPNLLANGAMGIAVGMATNIPPHNLGELIDGTIALMENPEITTDELMQYIPGPDFPTGGLVLGRTGLRNAYETGNGMITIRSKCEILEANNRRRHNEIIVTEIPYGVNKAKLIDRIAECVKEKIVEGIVDLRDETSMKTGTRIVIECRKDVNVNVLLNNLYKYTPLQTSFGINMIALVNGRPESLSLKRALEVYVAFQIEVISRRTKFDLDAAEARLHIVEGLIKAIDNIDEVVHIIRNSNDGLEKERLMERFELSDKQAQAILDMQLRRLSGLNRDKTLEEANQLRIDINRYQAILASKLEVEKIIRQELLEIKESYADKRRSEISLSIDLNIENEDLIPREDVIITITSKGYCKRMKQEQYKSQNRGGVGITGMKTNEDDVVEHVLSTSTHDYILFFTNRGRVYKMKAYLIPEGSRTSKGLPIVNLIPSPFENGEKLAAMSHIDNFDDENEALFFVTKKGIIKRTAVSQFKNIRTNGINAINLADDDELLQVEVTDGHREIVLGASNGKAIRFNEDTIRLIGRNAQGVRGMNLEDGAEIVGMAVITDEYKDILVITENGYGKRTGVEEYRVQTRGGKGVKTVNITQKNGALKTLRAVNDGLDLITTTNKGVVIRIHCSDISQTGRATQGVKLVRLRDDQSVSNVALVYRQEDEVTELPETVTTVETVIE